MTTRRIVRCTEGHPYDANAHEACPVCGAAPAGTGIVAPGPAGLPPPQKRGWVTAAILGGAVAIAVAGGIGFHLRRPTDDVPPAAQSDNVTAPQTTPTAAPKPPDDTEAAKAEAAKAEATKAEAEKAEAVRQEAARAEAANAEATKAEAAKADAAKQAAEKAQADEAAREDAARADAAKAEAEIAEAAKAEKARAEAAKAAAEKEAADKARNDAARQAPEANPRVAEFMTLDPGTVEAMRRALAPVDPAESNSTLDAFSPSIERQLRLSTLLREVLANERAVLALKARDYARTKTILSAIVSLPPIAPDIINLTAYKNLAVYYGRQGAPARDVAYAARLTTIALRGGLPSAMVFFTTRPGLGRAAHVEPDLLAKYFTAAVIQDPQMLEPVLRKRGLGVDEERSILNSFNSALSQRDWPTAVATMQTYNDGRLPVMELMFSKALIIAPNNAAFMDRALVGAVYGGAASYSVGTDLLGYFCLEGLDGVTKDAPNAAGWLIATLFGLPNNDTNWADSRERYERAKSRLSPDERQEIEELAREFGVE